MSQSITNPTQLVEEFKKSGEFDRLRKELRKEFRQSEGIAAFLGRIEDIAKQKFESDPKLQYMEEAHANKEVMQELDRYPIVERAVQDVPLLSDPAFIGRMRESMRKVLQQDRQASGQSAYGPNINGSSTARQGFTSRQQDGSDSDSSEESMDIEEDSD